jgi:hypothetical protein
VAAALLFIQEKTPDSGSESGVLEPYDLILTNYLGAIFALRLLS